METAVETKVNVKSSVPFFGVTNMERSLKFYIDGLGCTLKHWWKPEEDWNPERRIIWCWLELGEATIMLQEFRRFGEENVYLEGRLSKLPENLGTGVSINFQCSDSLALYREFKSRGVEMKKRPFVGNGLWCVNVVDPDGYKLWFNSPTKDPEESVLQEDGRVVQGSCEA